MKYTNSLISFLVLLLFGTSAQAQIPSYVPTNGLVGWWPFNGNANDESGNGNNGTVNGATLTPDRFGNPGMAYDFDGVDDYIQMVNAPFVNGPFTISGWLNLVVLGSHHPIVSLGEFGVNTLNRLYFSPDYGAFGRPSIGTGGASDITSSLIATSAGSWYHVTVVLTSYSVNGVQFFVNGQILGGNSSGGSSGPFPLNNAGFAFGKHSVVSGTTWFDGSLDDIGIWNRALTPCEVRALYLSSTQPYSSADSLTTCSSYIWPVTGLTYTQSGTYTDTLQSVQGCDSIVGLELTILQPTSSTLTESACGTYTLNGQTYTQSGNYSQTLTNAAGCDSVITLNLSITNLAASVSFTGGTLTASPSGATYQWVNCELGYQPIVGSTGQTFTPDSTGNYAVVVTSGPCTDTSACTSVVVVGMENGLQQVITLYPNPTDGLLNVAGLPEGSKYLLMDAQGRKIMKGTGSETLTLDLSSLPAGVYSLGVESQGSRQRLKVVVRK